MPVKFNLPKSAGSAPNKGLLVAPSDRPQIEYVSPNAIHPNPRNPKRHAAKQIRVLTESIREIGFRVPIIVNPQGMILAGHARHQAALRLKLEDVPILRATDLTEAKQKAFALADNKIAEWSEWDLEIVAKDLLELSSEPLNFDLDTLGFSSIEVDDLFTQPAPPFSGKDASGKDKLLPPIKGPIIPQSGDLWICGSHLLACADPAKDQVYADLMIESPGVVAILKPPVTDRSREEVCTLLDQVFGGIIPHMVSGAVVYTMVPWRWLGELTQAGRKAFGDLAELIVWARSNIQSGEIYNSQYEHVALYVVGDGPLARRAQFVQRRRYRTNLWNYPGRDAALPIPLVTDLLRDCSKRGDVVLHLFAGAGTTLIAAERTGRRARIIEPDAAQCDLALRSWEDATGLKARLATTSETFAEVADRRSKAKGASR
jgi:ParB-like nuclease domain/DNA methylase